jgi:voltage-gated potassium channel Kch
MTKNNSGLRRRRQSETEVHSHHAHAADAPRVGVIGRMRYQFDLALSRGPLVVIGYLGILMLAIILVATLLVTVLGLTGVNGSDASLGFDEAFWQSLLRVLNSGTVAKDQHWTTRTISLIVTLSGIFIAGSLIGLIAAGLNQKIGELRKGRSAVLEVGHTLVLGWSPRLAVILDELVIANESVKRPAFVVLADRPKDEMEDELRKLVPNTKNTRVVCRTGDIGAVADLRMVNILGARSVIVLSEADGDAGVVKAVLAARSIDPDLETIRIVAEFAEVEHAATLGELTKHRIATVHADRVISQVTAQACHQPGLAQIFRDLLDFEGDEIYIRALPELVGHAYREVLLAFEKSSVIGVIHQGRVMLNPDPAYRFVDGDEVIAISEDDSTLRFDRWRGEDDLVLVDGEVPTEPPQRMVIVGWSTLGGQILDALADFLATGSVVDIYVDASIVDPRDVVVRDYETCKVAVHAAPDVGSGLIEAVTAHRYDQAVVLGYRQGLSAGQADARTMLTLLALHKGWGNADYRPRVVAEMLVGANVDIAQSAGVDDFIVSDELSSLMIAQVSERLELRAVFEQLFDAGGCFIALYPGACYAPTEAVSFASIVASAARRGQTAIGLRTAAGDVVLNPPKHELVRLSPQDQVVILGPRVVTGRAQSHAIAEELPAPRLGTETPGSAKLSV